METPLQKLVTENYKAINYISAPRRSGKSTLIAELAVTQAILNVSLRDDVGVVCYSYRAVKHMRELIVAELKKRNVVYTQAGEGFQIEGAGAIIVALPHFFRGVSIPFSDLFLDEAAYISKNDVVNLLSLRPDRFFAISSPYGWNWFFEAIFEAIYLKYGNVFVWVGGEELIPDPDNKTLHSANGHLSEYQFKRDVLGWFLD